MHSSPQLDGAARPRMVAPKVPRKKCAGAMSALHVSALTHRHTTSTCHRRHMHGPSFHPSQRSISPSGFSRRSRGLGRSSRHSKVSCQAFSWRSIFLGASSAEAEETSSASKEKWAREEAAREQYNATMKAAMSNPFEYQPEIGLYYTEITPGMLVGTQIKSPEDVDRLVDFEGMTSVLNMQQDKEGLRMLRAVGPECLRSLASAPLPDSSPQPLCAGRNYSHGQQHTAHLQRDASFHRRTCKSSSHNRGPTAERSTVRGFRYPARTVRCFRRDSCAIMAGSLDT